MQFSFRSMSAGGRALHGLSAVAVDLNEAYAAARRFAASIVACSPGEHDWSGRRIDVLDDSDRHQISLPILKIQSS